MKLFLPLFVVFLGLNAQGQPSPVRAEIFVAPGSNTSVTKVGVRVKVNDAAAVTTLEYQGVSFYILYQSANASYAGVDDSKLVTTFGWGLANRQINAGQALGTPIVISGQSYNRRYIYLNSDENADGSHLVTLTKTKWDTLITVTMNNLQGSPVFGGLAYAQRTTDFAGASLTDPFFINIPFDGTGTALNLNPTGTPLPVLLTKFSAQCQPDRTTRVAWTTAQEMENKYFEVEKTTNGTDWSVVARLSASGNTSAEKNYQITDPEGGAAQYRLKQVDKDGKVAYSTIIRTSCDGRNVFTSLYPVPAKDVITLVIGSDKAVKTTLQVYDAKGRLVVTMPITVTTGMNNFKLPLHNLAVGEYILRSTDAGLEINKQFSIVR